MQNMLKLWLVILLLELPSFAVQTLSGTVFLDTGNGSVSVANNGKQDNGEQGMAGVCVKLYNHDRSQTYASSITDAQGHYTFTLPANATALLISVQPDGYQPMGGSAGSTDGKYDRLKETVSFSVKTTTSYTGVDFGRVPDCKFSMSIPQITMPGHVSIFSHQFTAGTHGQLLFTANDDHATLYIDSNCNGIHDNNEPEVDSPLNVVPNQIVCLLVYYTIPNLTSNSSLISVTAKFEYDNVSITTNSTLTDSTTILPATQGITLTKSVNKGIALPGEDLTYIISYKNTSSTNIDNIEIYDYVPVFTSFVAQQSTNMLVTAPLPGNKGPIQWHVIGNLKPGNSGNVAFTVRIDH